MNYLLLVLTYGAYLFVTAMYTAKAVKWVRLPRHLRWDLYPVMHEARYHYGGSYFEDMDWRDRPRRKGWLRGALFLLKEYVTMGEYFKRHLSYWLPLYLWHVGFMLIIAFHVCTFFTALAMCLGLPVEAGSPSLAGAVLYWAVLLMGVVSFASGLLGSIGVALKRLFNDDLGSYATPQNYLTYLFCLAIFGSGLYAWYFVDPSFGEYRRFWIGLITFSPVMVAPAAALHIVLFDLFLIYLPFTRSMHYITRVFAFFLIRWDDEPNLRGSRLEAQLMAQFGQRVTWAGPHIKSGETWADQVKK